MKAVELLREQFNSHVVVREKRPGVLQLIVPLFHEDGDMMDVFLDVPQDDSISEDQRIRITDHGLTMMRLSYTFEIDTPNKARILHRILAENGVTEQDGEFSIEATPDSLYATILQFSQAISKICNMRYFKRELLASLFDEMLAEFIEAHLLRFNPRQTVLPLPDRDDLEVDWEFHPNGVPLYVFAVRDVNRARLATISCLEFQRHKLRFKSIGVHEDIDKLPRKDRNRLTNACDKQFTSLEQFKENAVPYLEREVTQTDPNR